jgi:hypothetical protein
MYREIGGEMPVSDKAPDSVENQTAVWLFGRGLSMACGLCWDVPPEWRKLQRDEQIARIQVALRAEMAAPHVDTRCIQAFLGFLYARTSNRWRHLFATTNWDYLLQREIDRRLPEGVPWLPDRHVLHLNGTVQPGTWNRTPFLLPKDPFDQRTQTMEGNYAWGEVMCALTLVVVGLSFRCPTDQHFLRQLQKVANWMPIGESHCFIVNQNPSDLDCVSKLFQKRLREATVVRVPCEFGAWQSNGFPELTGRGVFARGSSARR